MITTNKPTLQEFHIEGVKHITPSNALEAVENEEAIMIDVREVNECMLECISLDAVFYHPMSEIMERLDYIPKDKALIVVCLNGFRSAKVANLLTRQGFENVANLDGGFVMWKSQNLPHESNISCGSCGCGCSK
jgi:rhodanese-related sulfurtransferase